MMRPRAFALILIVVGAMLFVAVVGTNVVLDPFRVLGTSAFPADVRNVNDRYLKFIDYQRAAGRYDGLIFGSSRAVVYTDQQLLPRTGVTFASFAVTQGMFSDHLPVLEYVLRERAVGRARLKSVLLFLDAHAIGLRPVTNRYNAAMLHPALTGESAGRFWWRYLTSIQVRSWRDVIRLAWNASRSAQARGAMLDAGRAVLEASHELLGIRPARAQLEPQAAPDRAGRVETSGIRSRFHYSRQLREVERFVQLCRQNDVKLTVVLNPLSRDLVALHEVDEIEQVIREVSRIVPVWDFSLVDPTIYDPAFFPDGNHFTPELAEIIVKRIFGEPVPAKWQNFGRLRSG